MNTQEANPLLVCLIDGEKFSSLTDLHYHLRKLKIKREDYYEKYYPRADLQTGEKIKFKDYTSYFKTDFVNKNNLKKFCKENPEKGLQWAINFLKDRKENKNLIYAPSHVELRTLQCPSIPFFEFVGDYNKVCESIGLTPKYLYNEELKFTPLPHSCKIYQDTREQNPFPLIRAQIKTLKFGDYALDDKHNKGLYIERKNLSDFVGTLGKGYSRFCREIERAKQAGAQIVVLVEEDFNKSSSFDKDWKLKRYVKVSPAHVFKNVRELLHEFDNVQFLFAKGREEATRLVVKLFEMQNDVSKIDLQYYYEKGLI